MKTFDISAIFSVIDRMTAPVRAITASVNAFSRSAQMASLQSQAMVHRAAAISSLRTQFSAASGAAGELARSVRNITIAAGGLSALGAFGASRFGSGIIETSAKFEALAASMTTQFEGNEKAARSAMHWVSEFAKKTPYEIEEATRAFISLKTMGIDPIKGDALRILGDAAAAFSVPIDNTVQAITDAMNRDTERLKHLGVTANIDSQHDAIKFSWREHEKDVTKTVQLSNKTLVAETILALWNKKYAGAMERLSKAWDGMTSNMADAWARFQLAIGDAGFFAAMKARLGGLYDAFNRFTESAKGLQLARDISNSLTGMANALLPSIGTLEGWAGSLADWLRNLDPTRIKAFASEAFGALRQLTDWMRTITMADVLSFFTDLRTVLSGLATAFRVVGSAARGVFDWVDQISGGNGAKVLGWLTGIGIVARSSIGRLVIAFARMAGPLLTLVKWSTAVVALRVAFGGLIGWVGRAGLVLTGLAVANPIIAGIVAAVVTLGYYAWQLYRNWDRVSAGVSNGAERMRASVVDAWAHIKQRAVRLTTVLVDDVTHRFRALVDGVTGAVSDLYRSVTGWFTDLRMAIVNIDWLGVGRDAMSAIWDGMKSIGSSIQDWVRGLFQFEGLGRMSGRMPWQGADMTPKPQMAAWIDQMAGVFGANADTLKRIAGRESSYRTASINTTDSNARKGTPSAGLFQFIEPTFNRFYDQAHKQHGAFLDRLGPKNWLNWRQQSAIAAWAFAHGQASNWSSWRGEPTKGPMAPPDMAGPISRSLKGLTLPTPDVPPAPNGSTPTPEPRRWLRAPAQQTAARAQDVQVANQIDVRILDGRVAATTRTQSSAATSTRVNVGTNRAGKPRYRDA